MVQKKKLDQRVLNRRKDKIAKYKKKTLHKSAKTGKKEKRRLKNDTVPPKSWPAEIELGQSTSLAKSKQQLSSSQPVSQKEALLLADTVLLLLDARNPLQSYKETKNALLVLTKIDLVPQASLDAWSAHFKAQNKDAVCVSFADQHFAEASLHRLTAALACKHPGASPTVSVIGYENTGRRTLLNALKQKTVQKGRFHAFSGCNFIDTLCVFADSRQASQLFLAGVGSFPADKQSAAEAILQTHGSAKLMLHYGLPRFKALEEFVLLRKEQKCSDPLHTLIDDWRAAKIGWCIYPN